VKVAILGVGLIGGSIGLAARARADATVTGYDPDAEVLERALARGAIERAASDLPTAVREAQAVFVAAPVGALPHTVSRVLELVGSDCVVSDVGSTKRALAAAARDQRFVGGHPLAGAETAGVEHARADLFEGANWYLTPAQGTSGVLYERLHRLLTSFGAQPIAIAAETHDRLLASTSHLPHVFANLLVAQASAQAGGESGDRLPGAGVLGTGPSFRDATRVAGANSAIWTDIYLSNRDALIGGIDDAVRRLGQVRALLEQGDPVAITAWNESARSDREALLGVGVAGGEVHELRVTVPNRPGVVADIALALGGSAVNIVDMAISPSSDNRQGVVALWVRGEQQAGRAGELIAELGLPVARA
jgi:prephenate dehydrogenase